MTEEIYESGWVLVKYVDPGLTINYMSVSDVGTFEWTTDNLKALRLARREDGDALARIIEDADAVEDHGWYKPAPPAETPEWDMTKRLCRVVDCDNFCEPRSTTCAKHGAGNETKAAPASTPTPEQIDLLATGLATMGVKVPPRDTAFFQAIVLQWLKEIR